MGVNTCKIMFMGHFYHFYTLCEEISKFGKKIISTDYLHPPLARFKVSSGAKNTFCILSPGKFMKIHNFFGSIYPLGLAVKYPVMEMLDN